MRKLTFNGKRYSGEISFSGPGQAIIGSEVSEAEAERLVKDFPDRFSIVTDEPVKKEMKPKTNRSMKPTKTK